MSESTLRGGTWCVLLAEWNYNNCTRKLFRGIRTVGGGREWEKLFSFDNYDLVKDCWVIEGWGVEFKRLKIDALWSVSVTNIHEL